MQILYHSQYCENLQIRVDYFFHMYITINFLIHTGKLKEKQIDVVMLLSFYGKLTILDISNFSLTELF